MSNISLCDTCIYSDTCERSDKGISIANHSICWKHKYEETENDRQGGANDD